MAPVETPPRVCHVTTTYPRHTGDNVPRFVADLVEHLRAEQGIDTSVIAPHHPGAALEEILGGVPVRRFRYAWPASRQRLAYGAGIPDNLLQHPAVRLQIPGFCASMAMSVARQLGACDIVHAHWADTAAVVGLANLFHQRPLVLTVHSLPPERSPLRARALSWSRHVLFGSRFIMSRAENLGYRCNGQVIHPGYDERVFGQGRTDRSLRSRFNIPSGATVIAAVGRMIRLKGFHVLLQAAPTFMAQRPDVHLVVAGGGHLLDELRAQAAALPVASRIHLPGALASSEVADLLANSDLYVAPGVVDETGRAEGLGVATLEAMASGLACVGARAGGIPETIESGVSGLLVETNDAAALTAAIGNLLDANDMRQKMGAAGRERARQDFTWSALARRVADVYRELTAERSRHARH